MGHRGAGAWRERQIPRETSTALGSCATAFGDIGTETREQGKRRKMRGPEPTKVLKLVASRSAVPPEDVPRNHDELHAAKDPFADINPTTHSHFGTRRLGGCLKLFVFLIFSLNF